VIIETKTNQHDSLAGFVSYMCTLGHIGGSKLVEIKKMKCEKCDKIQFYHRYKFIEMKIPCAFSEWKLGDGGYKWQ